MTQKKCPRAGGAAHAGECRSNDHCSGPDHVGKPRRPPGASDDGAAAVILLALLDGAVFAGAIRRAGKPCRIRLPDDATDRERLVEAHVRGAPATLTYHADGHDPWQERVEAVALAAVCPAADGHCRWIGIDLDATDHGERGLADPVHAARVISERTAAAGLWSGLLVARSRGGRGRHVFLIMPEPVALTDAVIGVAALTATAFEVAAADVAAYGGQHAFHCANGAIVCPGEAGAVEFVPHSTVKPRYGWALALPAAGAFRARGGGVVVDPFTNEPTHHEQIPRCEPRAWRVFIAEARAALSKRRRPADLPCRRPVLNTDQERDPMDRIDDRTRTFLDGRTPEGARNRSAFAASANLLGCGFNENEAERLVLDGAAACGLPEREARAAFRSAVRTVAGKRTQP